MSTKNNVLIGILSFLLLVQIGTFGTFQVVNAESEISVPNWIKDLSEFWSKGNISDKEFVTAIEFLIKSKIITSNRISIIEGIGVESPENEPDVTIPNWVRNNAQWFAEDKITDSEFVSGIEFMVKKEIIKSTKIKIIENDPVPVTDSDGDGIFDDVDVCPNEAETVNGFEDSDGCPDEVPVTDEITVLDEGTLPDKSLTISDVDITWKNSGWGDQNINLSWTYSVEHIDENGVGFPEDGYFLIEIIGVETVSEKANYFEENKFTGKFEGIDPGIDGGTVTITIISFVGDDRGNYVGDGDQKEIIIPPTTS